MHLPLKQIICWTLASDLLLTTISSVTRKTEQVASALELGVIVLFFLIGLLVGTGHGLHSCVLLLAFADQRPQIPVFQLACVFFCGVHIRCLSPVPPMAAT